MSTKLFLGAQMKLSVPAEESKEPLVGQRNLDVTITVWPHWVPRSPSACSLKLEGDRMEAYQTVSIDDLVTLGRWAEAQRRDV